MHVLFLAPDTHTYNHSFIRGLKDLGARVSAIGPSSGAKLTPAASVLLDGYQPCANILDLTSIKAAAEQLAKPSFDFIETIDEPLVTTAAALREHFQTPGLTLKTAQLCRDKIAMKEFLRDHDVPCALSARATSEQEAWSFAEECGYPIVAKPIAGFGSLATFRCQDQAELKLALSKLQPSKANSIALEEFVEGHEGFIDTLCDDAGIRHDFISHYYPTCLEAALNRWISPQIAVSNRIAESSYHELRDMNQRVVDALQLHNCATHLEWFFGPKGLKFGEIGARPAGEKIWDMHAVGNELDIYQEWARTILGQASDATPSRKYSVGSIQIRPTQDGHYQEHRGLEAAWQRCKDAIYEHDVPEAGTPTKGLDRGWLVNTWFRLKHEDYDEVRAMMEFIGETVQAIAK